MTDQERKVMEMALDALGTVREWEVVDYDPLENAITALRKALAQPEHGFDRTASHMAGEYVDTNWDTSDMAYRPNGLSVEQEPVAWEKNYDIACAMLRQAHDILATTQYPIKRPWVSLTDEEIDYIWGVTPPDYENFFEFPRAIEAKLKEKNNG